MAEEMGEDIERHCTTSKIRQKIYSASHWNPRKGSTQMSEIRATNSIIVLAWPGSCSRLSA